MAVLQSSYSDTPAQGFAGMVANGETSNRISRTVEDAAGIGFGKAAFRGAGDHGCTGTPTVDRLLGITIATYAPGANAASGLMEDKYPQYDTAGLMSYGVIWVVAAVAVADGDQAYVTPGGAFTNVAAGNVILPDWRFDQTTSGVGQIVRIAKRQ